MILFITSKFDPHVDFLIEQYAGLNKFKFFRLNTDDYLDNQVISCQISSFNQSMVIENKDGRKIDLSQVKSGYYRRPSIPQAIDKIEDKYNRELALNETKDFLRQFYYSLYDVKWLNTPWDIQTSRGRLNQLIKAKQLGFNIPNTLFTTQKSEFVDFFNKSHNGLIIKTIESGNCVRHGDLLEPIYTEKIDNHNYDSLNLDLIANSPCLFQEYIKPKYEIRVTSINGINLAVKIESKILDWRKKEANAQYSIYDLPLELNDRINKYLKSFNLRFGCFDFIVDYNNNFYFLELNPNGQWLWLELETGIPISRAIYDFLTS